MPSKPTIQQDGSSAFDESRAATSSEVPEKLCSEQETTAQGHDGTAVGRSWTTAERLQMATQRDQAAWGRDRAAASRDQLARVRDESADARDRSEPQEPHDLEAGESALAAVLLTASRAGASLRQQSAHDRIAARADREAAAADREQARADRDYAGLDELTGVFRRGTGELSLIREIDRSRRSGRSLVVAIIDVDGLKAINDGRGHAAGDALLRDVSTAITSTMRSYDVTVRWGGDEFLCALSETTLEVATRRVAQIQRALAARRPGASISAGLAEMREDTLASLIARADADLYRAKSARGSESVRLPREAGMTARGRSTGPAEPGQALSSSGPRPAATAEPGGPGLPGSSQSSFVSFLGKLTPSDRDALRRPGWKLYEAERATDVWLSGNPPTEMAWRHFVRLPAAEASDAVDSLVNALGYEPDALCVLSSKQEIGD